METGLFQGMIPTIVAEFFLIALAVAAVAIVALGFVALKNLSNTPAEESAQLEESETEAFFAGERLEGERE